MVEEYQDPRCEFTSEEANCKILADSVESIQTTEADKLMAYVVLALVGLERGNLVDLVREGIGEIIRRDRLSELRAEFSAEDYAAVASDLERIKARLGANDSPAGEGGNAR